MTLLNTVISELDINKIIPTSDYTRDLQEQKSIFFDKNIIVTGCAGSIGKELVMQLINYSPKNLYLIDKNEYQLFQLERLIKSLQLDKILNIKFLLINLENYEILSTISTEHIDIVFHAAAYKHVGLAEDNYSSVLYNNIISTYNISKYCEQNQILNLINVSTDKAVNPKSIMGISKRICEIIISKVGKNRNYYSVRFGNVINSSGSVIPIFLQQIKNDEKITISDLNVSRYFMSIPEAISLILLSVKLKKKKNILLLDMGKQIKI